MTTDDQSARLFSISSLNNADEFIDYLLARVRRHSPLTTTHIAQALALETAKHWEPGGGDLSALGLCMLSTHPMSPDQVLELLGGYAVLLANALQRLVAQEES